MTTFFYIKVIIWLTLSSCIVFFTRTKQYNKYGMAFVLKHSIIDMFIIANPIALIISPILGINTNTSATTLIIQVGIYLVSIFAYLGLKGSTFKKLKYDDSMFPYTDLALITICILVLSLIRIV